MMQLKGEDMNAGLNNASTAPRQSQVSECQNMLLQSIEALVVAVDEMEKRLDPVLRPIGPQQPSNKTLAPEPIYVALAENIRRNFNTVTMIRSRIVDIFERLEL